MKKRKKAVPELQEMALQRAKNEQLKANITQLLADFDNPNVAQSILTQLATNQADTASQNLWDSLDLLDDIKIDEPLIDIHPISERKN